MTRPDPGQLACVARAGSSRGSAAQHSKRHPHLSLSHSLAAVVSSVTGPRLGSLVSTDGVAAVEGLEAGWVLAHCTAAASLPCQPSPGMLGGWAELAGAGGCYHPATTPARPHHSPLMGASHTDTPLPPANTGASPCLSHSCPLHSPCPGSWMPPAGGWGQVARCTVWPPLVLPAASTPPTVLAVLGRARPCSALATAVTQF